MQVERTGELRQLQKGKAYYSEQIDGIKKDLTDLKNSPASPERAAREQFMMKRDNEDVFIIEEK